MECGPIVIALSHVIQMKLGANHTFYLKYSTHSPLNKPYVFLLYIAINKSNLLMQLSANQTRRGGRIGRALVLRAGDHGFKPRSSQTDDLSN